MGRSEVYGDLNSAYMSPPNVQELRKHSKKLEAGGLTQPHKS